jgi:hypothetical protein
LGTIRCDWPELLVALLRRIRPSPRFARAAFGGIWALAVLIGGVGAWFVDSPGMGGVTPPRRGPGVVERVQRRTTRGACAGPRSGCTVGGLALEYVAEARIEYVAEAGRLAPGSGAEHGGG